MKNILIIEDDVVFSRSISNWLEKKGMAIDHVSALSVARKELQTKEFGLLLADLRSVVILGGFDSGHSHIPKNLFIPAHI